jgi:hypothetical protein
VPLVLLSRELDFRRRLFPELTASLVASVAAIVLAFAWLRRVEPGLAGDHEGGVGHRARLVCLALPPALAVSARYRLVDLYNYGKHVMSSQGLILLITNVDNAIVGRYARERRAGQYQFAYNTTNQPATQITSVHQSGDVPGVLAHGRRRSGAGCPHRLRARYYLTISPLRHLDHDAYHRRHDLFAPAFINGLYGEAWAPRSFRSSCWRSTDSSAPSPPTWAASFARWASPSG